MSYSTVQSVIRGALRLIQAVAAGENPTGNEYVDALSTLNSMVDSWSSEKLIINATVREEFTLTVGDGRYSIGTGGDFNTSRPEFIESLMIELQSGTPQELPVSMLSIDEWNRISDKETTGSIPRSAWLEGTHPLEYVNLWPVPSVANKLVIYSRKAISTFTLSEAISMPPGYVEALKLNLALRLAPEYGRPIDPVVMKLAMDAKENIKRKNIKPQMMVSDAAGLTGSRSFDYRTGD